MKIRKFICVLLALLTLACTLPVMTASAAETQTVSFSSPAIGADTGSKVTLSSYAVEFKKGTVTAADKITWASDDITITSGTVTPDKTGVYTLKATAGGTTKNVYLVVKAPADKEYVLYYDDFSADTLSSYRTVQQTSGAQISIADGKLILNANNSGDSYIRLLLPDWLGDFGDYSLTTSFTIKETTAKSRWLSLMARIQNNNYPYWQAAIRQNAKASNGTEIAERNSSNKWNVTHTGPFTEDISASKYYELNYNLVGKNAVTTLNGTRMLYSNTMTFDTGDIGFHVRGLTANFDYIKVALAASEIEATAHSLNEVRAPSSNIILTPAMVSYVDSAATLSDIQKNSPAVAVLYLNSALDVVDGAGAKISALDDALAKLDKKIIPSFYIKDQATMTALITYLKANEIKDMYFMSSDAALLKSARSTYRTSFGILDCTGSTVASEADLLALRDKANESRAKVILLSESAISYDNVQYLQTLLMTVWSKTADTQVSYLKAITAGVNGMVTADRATLEQMFTKYFVKNTMIRPFNIIGHRGIPSLAQENTVAGSLLAYEKGATMIEMDVYVSADNQIIVMHDGTIDRTTNGVGNTESFTVAQLQKYVVDGNTSFKSEPIPTLEDYFKAFKDKKDAKLIVEIKSGASTKIEPLLKELIQKYDMADQINVITFSESHMNSMRSQLPNISVGYLTGGIALNESEPLVSLEAILAKIQPMATTFNPSYANGTLGPNLLREASYRGITMWPYTINNNADLHNYILYGTHGITTNYAQYVTNYAKRLTVPASEITVGESGTEFELTKTTYGHKTLSAVKDARLVVVEADGLDVSYANGKLSAKGTGTATVFFQLTVNMTNGKTYAICSEPVLVKSESSATETTPAETTPAETPAETTPAQPAETTPADTTEPAQSGGCGSVMMPGMALAAMLGAAYVLGKKNN